MPPARPHRLDRPPSRCEAAAPAPRCSPPNQLERFYRGGARIWRACAVRARPANGGGPEDWVGSTTTALGADSRGPQPAARRPLSARRDRGRPGGVPRPRARRALGRRSRAAGQAARCRRAAARCTFTPAGASPATHSGCASARPRPGSSSPPSPDAVVYLGFKAAVERATLASGLDEQDADAMLAAMHEVPVAAGRRRCSSPPGRCTRSAPASCWSSCRSPPISRYCSNGSGSASTTAPRAPRAGLGARARRRRLDAGAQRARRPPTAARRPEAVTDLLPAAADPYFRAAADLDRGRPVSSSRRSRSWSCSTAC